VFHYCRRMRMLQAVVSIKKNRRQLHKIRGKEEG
jgi:hypothetical protein